jgi:putative DNA primase/helicase
MVATAPSKASPDVVRFLRALWRPGEVRELRVPKYNQYNQTASGYFDSLEHLAATVTRFDGVANVFVTLNPVAPDLLARATNRVRDRAESTTGDQEIDWRRWLLVDIDPVRPSGISSTATEQAAAFRVLHTLTEELTAAGWPQPLTASSGNGAYAIYAIDLPNDAESTTLIKNVLESLAVRHNAGDAHIDTAVANAARLVGLIGTLKMKGDSTPERPHRNSALISAPAGLVPVSREQLEQVASARPQAAATLLVRSRAPQRLTDLLDQGGIEYREQSPDIHGITWYHVRQCPFHEDGKPFECGVGQKLPDGAFAGHCFHPEGQDRGWQEWKIALGLEVGPRHLRSLTKPAEARTPTDFARTDAGNAELFAWTYSDEVRYDHRRKRWFRWDEHHWSADEDASVYQLAINAVRQRYLHAMSLTDLEERERQAKFAIASENRQRIEALLALAKTKPPITERGDSWDANAWLLGVRNGVLNLRTGELLSGQPGQRITRFTDIDFDSSATCPRWLQFLNEVFDDEETIRFIQKAVGYSLTGDISEQCVFTCYGTGANGKSVFLITLRDLAGTYAYNAPFSILELKNQAQIPNDVAALAGARLVTASETNDGTRLNEARLKALTGGDPITARFLYGEMFTFQPLAKIWLAVNHRPRVYDQSQGFWRRLRLVPFNQTFIGNQDKQLGAKLRRELPGILAWAVQGCLAWQDEGLEAPSSVALATETYRRDSDPLGEFIDESCVLREDVQAGANECYLSYQRWAHARGMKEKELLSSKTFGTRMTERFEKKRNGQGLIYVGIGLRSVHRSEPVEPAFVQGRVQGPESDAPFSPNSPLVNPLTQEVGETSYTTLHPTQPEEVSACAVCGGELWTFTPDGTGVCRDHLQETSP